MLRFVFCKNARVCVQYLFCMHMLGSARILGFSIIDARRLRPTLIEILNTFRHEKKIRNIINQSSLSTINKNRIVVRYHTIRYRQETKSSRQEEAP